MNEMYRGLTNMLNSNVYDLTWATTTTGKQPSVVFDANTIRAMYDAKTFTPTPKHPSERWPGIRNITVYNNRVVKVDFIDGTYTKCEAQVDENGYVNFDLYTGLAFCMFKKILGKDGHKQFNDMMRYVLKRYAAIENEKAEEAAEAERVKARRRKKMLKRAAKKAKERQAQIDIQSAGLLDALRKYRAENGEDFI